MVAMRRDSKLLFELEVCKISATPNIASNRHILNIVMLASKVCALTSCCILTVSGETRMSGCIGRCRGTLRCRGTQR